MKQKLQNVIDYIGNNAGLLGDKQVTAGFDGFVDYVVRAIKNVNDENSCTFFQNIGEFGSYIVSKQGKSCIVELEEQVVKIGGNMPILANALGNLGVKVNCIGAMGYPEIEPVFKGMSSNCTLYSVSEPGYCTALEFNDGKIMLAKTHTINSMTWDNIKDIVGLDKLIHFFTCSNLIGMFNWSELYNSSSIWEGILQEVLPHHTFNSQEIVYFDLSDGSKRDKVHVSQALSLIEKFAGYYKVILSLNENETRLVFDAVHTGRDCSNIEDMGERIYSVLRIDTMIIHSTKYSVAWDRDGKYRVDNLYIEFPRLSTGGGDNFNAGVCMAQLMDLDMASSLILANAMAGFYVKHGYSAGQSQLIGFLREWQAKIA